MSGDAISRDSFLALAQSFKPSAVRIEGVDQTFYVRPLTLSALTRFQRTLVKEPERAPATMLLACLCDQEGNRLFKPEDEALLAEIPSSIAEALVEKIGEISGVANKIKDNPSGN